MSKENSEITYHFLRDKPLSYEKEFQSCRFGHGQIAQTLVDIVIRCDTPFTIGLFGKWGSGKSSITNNLVHELRTKHEIAAVVFDVWKHQEGDSLRRSFLKELVCQLQRLNSGALAASFKLSTRLDCVTETKSEGALQFEWSRLKPLRRIAWVVLGTLVVAGVLCLVFGGWRDFIDVMKTLAAFALGGAFGTLVVGIALKAVSAQTETRRADRLQDPHEFESEFGRVLREMKRDRILIVFDNIDRVTHDVAVAMLSTIKTFLEPKDEEIEDKSVVFMIPCDRDAIAEHIKL